MSAVTALAFMLNLIGCGIAYKLSGKEDMRRIFTCVSIYGNTELIDDSKITQQMLNDSLYNVGVGDYETGLFLLEKRCKKE